MIINIQSIGPIQIKYPQLDSQKVIIELVEKIKQIMYITQELANQNDLIVFENDDIIFFNNLSLFNHDDLNSFSESMQINSSHPTMLEIQNLKHDNSYFGISKELFMKDIDEIKEKLIMKLKKH